MCSTIALNLSALSYCSDGVLIAVQTGLEPATLPRQMSSWDYRLCYTCMPGTDLCLHNYRAHFFPELIVFILQSGSPRLITLNFRSACIHLQSVGLQAQHWGSNTGVWGILDKDSAYLVISPGLKFLLVLFLLLRQGLTWKPQMASYSLCSKHNRCRPASHACTWYSGLALNSSWYSCLCLLSVAITEMHHILLSFCLLCLTGLVFLMSSKDPRIWASQLNGKITGVKGHTASLHRPVMNSFVFCFIFGFSR